MLESIRSLLKGITLIDIVEENKETIIELSIYDKQHGINRKYPCINTCISDKKGGEWFTKTYSKWSDFIQDLKAYLSYYQEENQNADYLYIKECDFL